MEHTIQDVILMPTYKESTKTIIRTLSWVWVPTRKLSLEVCRRGRCRSEGLATKRRMFKATWRRLSIMRLWNLHLVEVWQGLANSDKQDLCPEIAESVQLPTTPHRITITTLGYNSSWEPQVRMLMCSRYQTWWQMQVKRQGISSSQTSRKLSKSLTKLTRWIRKRLVQMSQMQISAKSS